MTQLQYHVHPLIIYQDILLYIEEAFTNKDELKSLVDKGDAFDETPLMLAARGGKRDTTMILLEMHSSPHRKDFRGRNVLHHIAVEGRSHHKILTEIAKRFSDPSNPHSYINDQDWDGNTPLHLAAKADHAEMVREILELAEHDLLADPTIRNGMGWTARTEAVHRTYWFSRAHETLKAFNHFQIYN